MDMLNSNILQWKKNAETQEYGAQEGCSMLFLIRVSS